MNDKKKIVMLGTSLDTMGGIAAVVKVYREGGLFERFPVLYLTTHCDGGAMKKMSVAIAAWFRFAAWLLQGKIALVHVHTASNASFWRKAAFMLLALLFRVPFILHLHGGGFKNFYQKESGRLAKAMIRGLYNRAECVIVLSNTWQQWLQSISNNPRIVPIYNPVSLPPLSELEGRAAHNIVCLGRLGQWKGTYDLLEAMALLVDKYPQVRLLLGGDGELEQVAAMARQLGISRHVEILGWVGQHKKTQLLAHASIFTLPSHAEGLPMSMLEAMAAGLPVVSTPVGGIPEAVSDGVEGYLVAPGDRQALADKLERLLADAALRSAMGAAARSKVEHIFSTEHVLPQIERLYQDLGVQPKQASHFPRVVKQA